MCLLFLFTGSRPLRSLPPLAPQVNNSSTFIHPCRVQRCRTESLALYDVRLPTGQSAPKPQTSRNPERSRLLMSICLRWLTWKSYLGICSIKARHLTWLRSLFIMSTCQSLVLQPSVFRLAREFHPKAHLWTDLEFLIICHMIGCHISIHTELEVYSWLRGRQKRQGLLIAVFDHITWSLPADEDNYCFSFVFLCCIFLNLCV